MNHCLKVRLDHDDDGTAGIVAVVKNGSFSGEGEAWFNLSEIEAFATQLGEFAKSLHNPPSIEGGNWDGKGSLKEKLLSLKVYSFSSYRLGIHVELADYPYTDCRDEEISRVSVELKPLAQDVIEFAQQLSGLVNTPNGEALLECR